jgi:hypothetical protein
MSSASLLPFLTTLLRQMRHAPYSAPSPDGYATEAEQWISAGALLERMTFAANFAQGRVGPPGTFDAFRSADLSPVAAAAMLAPGPGDLPRTVGLAAVTNRVLANLLPGVEASELAEAIVRDLSRRSAADPGDVLARAIALTLGSPDFQRY